MPAVGEREMPVQIQIDGLIEKQIARIGRGRTSRLGGDGVDGDQRFHHQFGAKIAIALAVRVNAPIYAADDVIAESSIEFEGDPPESEESVVDEFREFLEQVRPEDFRTGEGGEG